MKNMWRFLDLIDAGNSFNEIHDLYLSNIGQINPTSYSQILLMKVF